VNTAAKFLKSFSTKVGCAGGHRAMAKGLGASSAWEKSFSVSETQSADFVELLRHLIKKQRHQLELTPFKDLSSLLQPSTL